MWFLLFIKQLPVMAISEIKEILPPKMKGHAHAPSHLEHNDGSAQAKGPALGGAH